MCRVGGSQVEWSLQSHSNVVPSYSHNFISLYVGHVFGKYILHEVDRASVLKLVP